MTDSHRLYFYFWSVLGVGRRVVKFILRQLRLTGPQTFAWTTKLPGEFYFRFRSAYHVTLSRGSYPHQGTTHNGHQRATWYCLQSTTKLTTVGHRPLYSRYAGAISWTSETTFPYGYGSFVLATPTEPPGRNRREFRPARSPLCRRLRRSLSSQNWK